MPIAHLLLRCACCPVLTKTVLCFGGFCLFLHLEALAVESLYWYLNISGCVALDAGGVYSTVQALWGSHSALLSRLHDKHWGHHQWHPVILLKYRSVSLSIIWWSCYNFSPQCTYTFKQTGDKNKEINLWARHTLFPERETSPKSAAYSQIFNAESTWWAERGATGGIRVFPKRGCLGII